ncbi:zinc-binding dehydrogenase [Conexibacter sp. W3-3-2]|uniref:NADP-dependent oxidoreductase n=1 Tax=Conexibacter sp. W3-3-2 TaxID=2675227 RepID=UPI0012B7F1FD|nr:NADP-dependent oxidoreductase [Conexibacter sp. W3-3-2]MTD44621.1 zinc-binding dehydrogenase [Conexibacter sp. W3-3-2]
MVDRTNRCYRLRRRPDGLVTPQDLELVEEGIPPLRDGQALVRTSWLSVDPTNRIWMSDLRGYLPPVAIDAVMRGLGIGEVVESRRDDFPVGAHVTGMLGFQDHCLVDDALLEAPLTVLPDPLPAPPQALLGALGHTGITAWLGIEDICRPAAGETVVVSAAAGAVGSIAGQLAKARGARVVGLAGSPEKCRHVVEDLGFDACVNYKDLDWAEQLARATPDGVDADFENVGGEIMDAVLLRLNIGARIALCGMISEYNDYGPGGGSTVPGQRAIGQLIMQRATMTGFLVLDHAARFPEAIAALAALAAEGRLRWTDTVVDGFESTIDALNQLFSGANTGKLLVRV